MKETGAGQTGAAPADAGAPALAPEPSVIRTGEMHVRAADPFGTADVIAALATGFGGRVSARADQNPGKTPVFPEPHPAGDAVMRYPVPVIGKTSHLVLRVPEARLDDLVAKVRALAGIEVERFSVSSSDISDQLLDLGARLRSKKAEEEQYLALLRRSDQIADILQVTRELAAVRTHIERLEAQQAKLRDQASFSTLAVSVQETAQTATSPAPGYDPVRTLLAALSDLARLNQALADTLIRLTVYALEIGVLVAAGLVVRAAWRRFRR